jgi:hypothetical protein
MYTEEAILHSNDFITTSEAQLLENYLRQTPDFEVKHVWAFQEDHESFDTCTVVEDDKIIELMKIIAQSVEDYALSSYFPKIGVESSSVVIEWRRPLELIGWTPFSGLAPHADGNEGDPGFSGTDRRFNLGVLIYLNDDYKGGEINFPDWGICIKPVTGDIVMFPCHYIHEVLEVFEAETKEPVRRFTMPIFFSCLIKQSD